MTPTYDSVPHRLIGNFIISGADAPENAQVVSTNAGGYGTCDWDQRTAPSLGAGDAVTVISEGVHIFEGHVQGVTTGVGPVKTYHVSCLGRYDKLRNNEAVQAVFVDRDLSQLQTADCGWAAWSEGAIGVDTTYGVQFNWPTVTYTDPVLSYVSAPRTHYDHTGNNLPPGWSLTDFPAADAFWTAAYYQMAGGKNVTRLSFVPYWNTGLAGLTSLTTPDYDSPIGPPDDTYGNRFSRYPSMNVWRDFYGVAPLPTLFAGVYACDDPEDLPTDNPQLMYRRGVGFRNGATCLFMVRGDELGGMGGVQGPVVVDCNHRLIVFYAGYVPVQLPRNQGTTYSKNADHLVRTKWVAENQYFCPPCGYGDNQWAWFSQLQFYGMGYKSKDDGSDDLRDVFSILFPDCKCDSMPIPASPDEATGLKATTSIALRTPMSELAAIPDLLSLYPTPVCWGVWEDGILKIEHDLGSVSVGDEPGVDTTGASQTSAGALDYVLVDYQPATTSGGGVSALVIPQPLRIIVDALGEWELADPTEAFDPELRIGYLDATASASSPAAAALQGQLIAASRLPDQWTGVVTLQGIAGASTWRPGKKLNAPGIDGALITQVQVDANSDTAVLSLGSTGYYLRFPLFVPGKPLTANPLAVRK